MESATVFLPNLTEYKISEEYLRVGDDMKIRR